MQAFADDVAILVEGDTRRQLEENSRETLEIFENSCTKQKLTIAHNKSFAIIFSKNNPLARKPQTQMSNKKIKVMDQLKYLGVIIDNRLTWIPHIQSILKKKQVKFSKNDLKE